MIVTKAGEELRLTTSVSGVVHYSCHYVTSASVMTDVVGLMATPTVLLALGAQSVVKTLTMTNTGTSDAVVRVTLGNAGSGYVVLYQAYISAGCSLSYNDRKGFQNLAPGGKVMETSTLSTTSPRYPFSPSRQVAGSLNALGSATGQVYLHWMGYAHKDTSTVRILWKQSAAAAAVTWAEAAVYRGVLVQGVLTWTECIGWVSAAVEVTTTGTKVVTVSLANPLREGDSYYVGYGVAATTVGSPRTSALTDEYAICHTLIRAARPSLEVPGVLFSPAILTTAEVVYAAQLI